MAHDALLLSDIDAYYGDSHVLHRVSLRLAEGRLLGLLGRNGAGKSTCMSVAVGLLPPRRGAVAVHGGSIAARNLKHVEVLPVSALNPLSLASYDKVLVTSAAVKLIEERLQ